MSTSSTRPPSCMYCFGELSPMEGTPANMLFPSERDSASSRSRPPPRARFLGEERGWLFLESACLTCSQTSRKMSGIKSAYRFAEADFNQLIMISLLVQYGCNYVFFSISINLFIFSINHFYVEWIKMTKSNHNTGFWNFKSGILNNLKLFISDQNWHPLSFCPSTH